MQVRIMQNVNAVYKVLFNLAQMSSVDFKT